MTNTKWFDKLTTTLSKVEGQITMTEIQNSKKKKSLAAIHRVSSNAKEILSQQAARK
jgi:hypothetical protein